MAGSDRPAGQGYFPFSESPFAGSALHIRHRQEGGTPRNARIAKAGKSAADMAAGREAAESRDRMGSGFRPDPGFAPRGDSFGLRRAGRNAAAAGGGLRLLPLAALDRAKRNMAPKPHTRPDHMLIWVTAGSLLLSFPRQSRVMRDGDVHFIPAGTAFGAQPMPGAVGHVLHLPPSMARDTDPPLPRHALAGRLASGIAGFLANLRELAASAAEGQASRMRRDQLNLLSLRLARLAPPAPPASQDAAQAANRPLLARFLALASAQLGQDRTVSEIAEQLDTSTAALDRACMASHGKRAVQMIHDLRLQRAAEMLRLGAQSPSRIATELGYCSHAHFTRAFVAATGRSPDIFRAQSR